jgi:predicted RecA/RadA family phage recombinase
MAQNHISPGKRLKYVIPSATTITSGQLVKVGDIVGVALGSGTTGDEVIIALSEAFLVKKKAAQAFTQGVKLYINAANEATTDADDGGTPTAVDHVVLGWAYEAAASADTEAAVKLLG